MRFIGMILAISAVALAQDGAALFDKNCATCHRPESGTRAPLKEAIARLSSRAIIAALETGSMKAQGAALTASERTAIAEFLSKANVPAETNAGAGYCASPAAMLRDAPGWNGWGVDLMNSRFQPREAAGITPGQLSSLKLKWAFGLPHTTSMFGQPAVAGGRVFFGTENGEVYSLDARSGCIYWTYKAAATVRTAISIDPALKYLYFGDVQANVYSLDAASGTLAWKVKVDDHPFARVTGAPTLHAGRLYVPVSSVEEVPGGNPKYACCTFRGSVVALDAATGKQIWKSYTVTDPPKATRVSGAGTQMMGPAGAAVWSSPTIDLARKAIYVATGNSYADPPVHTTDAVLSFDMETGSLQWSRQMTENDGWNFSCIHPNKSSCPEHSGEDLDFGSSPILRTLAGGRRLLILGQKSAVVHAVDPDAQGKIVWQVRVGRGGALGGVEWGPAADDDAVYVALSDIESGKPEAGGGLFALRIPTGEKIWYAAPPKPACAGKFGCSAAQMAPVTVIPGVVFSGSMDGHLRAYSTADGKLIWDFDTLREFETVNGVRANGGSLNATGATLARGMLYVNSGYGQLGGIWGNVLLAFSVEGK